MTTENPDFLLYIGSLRETAASLLPISIDFAKLPLPGRRLAKMLCIFARYLIGSLREAAASLLPIRYIIQEKADFVRGKEKNRQRRKARQRSL